jgi:eukaryotic-like serine/threonine-protein kinase
VNSQAPHDRTGELLGGRYRLVERLDGGGQGVVYRADDLRDGDQVAVKILHLLNAHDPEWRARMLREAHALTVLTGSAAVRVYDQTWTHDGAFCIVMELLRGRDFEDHLRAREAAGEPLSLADLRALLEPVVDTLERAHAQGILHRDLKPGNVYVTESGGVRLLDFGLAKFLRMPSFTRAGIVAGSPSYIAPEIWSGTTELDQRIDVYSLGALAFRALAGRPPFAADSLKQIFELVTSGERPSLRDVRPDLSEAADAWMQQMLAIRREHRFARVRAAWNALSHVDSGAASSRER